LIAEIDGGWRRSHGGLRTRIDATNAQRQEERKAQYSCAVFPMDGCGPDKITNADRCGNPLARGIHFEWRPRTKITYRFCSARYDPGEATSVVYPNASVAYVSRVTWNIFSCKRFHISCNLGPSQSH